MVGYQIEEIEPCTGRCRVLLAAYLTALLFAGWDLVRVTSLAPALSPPASAGLFIAVSWALGALLVGALVLARGELARVLHARGPAGLALSGVVDVAVLFGLCVVLQDPRTLDGDQRALLLGASILAIGVLSFYSAWIPMRIRNRIACVIAAGLLVLAFVLIADLRASGPPWVHLALHLVVAAALARLLPAAFFALRLRPLLLIGGFATLLVACSAPLLSDSAWARSALHQKANHARAWAAVYGTLADADGDGATELLGGRDCNHASAGVFPGASERARNGIDENCDGSDGPPQRRARVRSTKGFGAAAGSDVLILSVDSLRWDRMDDLRALSDELGPHARFDRAVSPASGTKESMAATSRGRPVRALKFEGAPSARGRILWRDPSPTLAHSLLKAGYRALTVPTSNVAEPRIGVLPGFDSVWVANFDGHKRLPSNSPFTQRYVPAEDAMPVVLRAARETPNPLCVWLHVMEPHAPYHVQDEAGAPPIVPYERYVRSVRETSPRLAEFVREFIHARGGKPPLIAVFGDHGEEFGEHGGKNHASTVYAEQVRVAFLLAGPGVPAGRYDAPVATSALPATLLDLLGLDAPESMTEPSLLPALYGEAAFSELAVSEVYVGASRMIGYTHARYRYLLDPVYDVELLFDSKLDPYEQHDLSALRPDALAMMRQLARTWDDAH